MSDVPEIGRRGRRILHAVVTEYLQSGEAVGSRTVTRRHDLGLSPASVRNVMADLEEAGLLEQRHTSAGRVPTETGLRFFIDALLKVRGVSSKEKEEIRARMMAPTRDEVLQRASRLLSDLTQHAALILTPSPGQERLGHVEFVPLRNGRLLAILVTADGRIENRLVEPGVQIDLSRLDRVHNYLNGLLSGLTLGELRDRVLRELGEDKNRYDTETAAALRLGSAVFVDDAGSAGVVVSGHSHLVDTATEGGADSGARMRELLRALEDKETLIRLLDRTRSAEGVQVFLGAENPLTAASGAAMVAIPYGPGEAAVGAIAVLGPRRMNYGKVMSVVDVTADVVSQILSEI
jgi:heat-inducible transcriptional repressor